MEIKRPEQAMNIIYTAVILHNFLINTDDSINTLQTPNVDTNSKRGYGVDPRNMCRLGRPNTLNDEVKITRENFVDLFSPD